MADLWKVRKVGQPPAFESPVEMWERSVEYFEWCKRETIEEIKLFNFQGVISSGEVPHMRAMTQAGLCAFLNIGVSTWHDYKKKPEFSEVTKTIEEIMYEQKFSGAAAGMLNPNIIARDLGLVDNSNTTTEITHKVDETLASKLTGGSKK